MQKNTIQILKPILVLFFPFFSFLTALCNMKSKNAYIVIALFYLLFGLAFTPENEAADSYRYAEQFHSFASAPEENLKYVLNAYFGNGSSTQGHIKDIYIYIMYYLSAILGGQNVHVLFFLFSVVFTFFALKSLKFVTNNVNYRNDVPMYILLFLFIYSNNIFNINGVRFWTASWVAVYLTLKIIIDRKYIYAIFLLSLPLIHASFTIYTVFAIVAFLVRSKISLLCKVYIISFFFGEIGLQIISYVKDSMPVFIQNMIWNYTESDWAQSKMDGSIDQQTALYARILTSLPRYYELGLLYLASRKYKTFRCKKFIGFTLAFISLINICAIIPSIGRFYIVGYPFIIYIWVNEHKSLKCYNNYLYLAPAIYAYSLFQWVRSVISVTDITLYLSNTFHITYRAIIR